MNTSHETSALNSFLASLNLDPALEVRMTNGSIPEKLATFNLVLINVPTPYDENANTGDKHMKLVPEHYMVVENTVLHIPKHYLRGDFIIASEKRSAICRNFYVSPENLGKKVLVEAEVLRKRDGSISVNFVEVTSTPALAPEWTISMRPVKPGEQESSTLFFANKTDKCLEFVPSKRS